VPATAICTESASRFASPSRSKVSTERWAARPTLSSRRVRSKSKLRHDAVGVLLAPQGEVLGHRLPLPELGADQPVDDLGDPLVDPLRQVGDHGALEVGLHLRLVHQVDDPGQAHGFIEEADPPVLELAQDVVDVGEPEAELALHVLLEEGHLALDVLDRREVLLEQPEPAVGDLQVALGEVLGDPQGIHQLQPHPLLLVEGVDDVALQGLKAALGEEGVVAAGFAAQGEPGSHREDLRGEAEEGPGALGHEGEDAVDVLGGLQDVDLVDHDHDLLPPVADALEEGALALGERTVGRGDEEHHVRAGHELAGDRLVLAVDGVGARGIDDVDVLEQLDRGGDDVERVFDRRAGDRAAVLDDVDVGGGGGDPLLEDLAPQEGVDEGALAGVELAGDHEEEELVELERRTLESLLVVGRGVEPGQGLLQIGDQPAVFRQQLVLVPVENSPQHGSPARARSLARGVPCPGGGGALWGAESTSFNEGLASTSWTSSPAS
jgi:hypothetical protein